MSGRVVGAAELAEQLNSRYAALLPAAPKQCPEFDAAVHAARVRLGVRAERHHRDGQPIEQTTMDLRPCTRS